MVRQFSAKEFEVGSIPIILSMKYAQCKLFRDNGDGSVSWTTAWIPQKFSLEPKLTIRIDSIPWIIL